MEHAAHHASAQSRPQWIVALLTVTAFSSACSYFPRSSLEALSPETQARVASSLEQNPPTSASRYPRGVPYQPLDQEEQRLLETVVVPQLYGVAPPAPAAEPRTVAPATASVPEVAMATTEPAPPLAEDDGWTPYQRLSAEEKAFLEEQVFPRLSPVATTSRPRQRVEIPTAAPTAARPGSASLSAESLDTTPTETTAPPSQTVMTAPATAAPTTPPATATAPGPRRDRLDDAAEALPGPRVEKLEAAGQGPTEEFLLPSPQAAPITPAPTTVPPTAPSPPTDTPATPTNSSEEAEPPGTRFPRAGEAVAATANPVTGPVVEEVDSDAPATQADPEEDTEADN